jgi:hypothetical protein
MKFYLTTALTLALVITPLCAFAKSSDSEVPHRGQGRRAQQHQQELILAYSGTITTTRVSTFNT